MSNDALESALAALPTAGGTAWRVEDGKLALDLAFASFTEAFAFMTAVALQAQAQDHHPDWSNVYNRVSIRLWSHDLQQITQRDLSLAAFIADTAARWLR